VSATVLDGRPAAVLTPWVREQRARGERDFVFIPFFISAQGAIGSALRHELETLQKTDGDFDFTFTDGLAVRGSLAGIVAARVRETIAAHGLQRPAIIVVDHGGPSGASAIIRDEVAVKLRALLAGEIGELRAASMEGAAHPHNLPLLADALTAHGFDCGDVVLAPLFLSPGRHAGPNGDLTQIAHAAEDRLTPQPLRCHFAGLVGTHPLVATELAAALRDTLAGLSSRPIRPEPPSVPSISPSSPIFA
jgi:sirohydrochlorin ferrochelatase